MQHEQNAINWFMQMVEKGILNPLDPDMSLVPNDILSQLCQDLPGGTILPTQASDSVSHFLFIACKVNIQKRKGWKRPRPFTVKASEIFSAQERFLILVKLETLKRAGFIKYQTNGSWHDKNAEVAIAQASRCPERLDLPPMPSESFSLR